ncbi:MAG TPA: hypothetical protein VFW83_03155 [Bryobacteraceae bacterium]|nr:hypothetical protein [Bryobacteraceae bacterium]
MNTDREREVAAVGAASVHVSRACFVEQFRNIEAIKKGPSVLQVGKFSMPPQLSDLRELTLDAKSAGELRHCEIGNCSVKVPPAMLDKLPLSSGGESMEQLNAVFRQALLDYVKAYLANGESAMIVYRDKSAPVSSARQFQLLLDSWPELGKLVPDLRNVLLHPSKLPQPGMQEFLYWSKESFESRPAITMTDVILYEPPGQEQTWVASKQIYASHYFDASLGVSLLRDRPSGDGVYVAYANRSILDLLGGFFGGIKRSLIRTGLKSAVRKNLEQTVQKVEASCGP